MFSLYADQERDKRALRTLFGRFRCVLYAAATGSGKTVIAGNLAQSMRRNGLKILILVHRRELVKQFYATLKNADLHREVGFVCPGYTPTPWAPIQIAMIFSWARRKPIFRPDYIIVDEAHHAKAQSWHDVLAMYTEARVLGMTATPVRLDGKPLNPPFEAIHCGDSIGTLIENKRLAPVRVIRVPIGFIASKKAKSYGDYSKRDLDKKATPAVVANAANAYCRYIPGRKTIMFGVTKRHAKETAMALKERGVRAAYVGDETEPQLREDIFTMFADGHIDVVCNVSLIDEGFDVPDCTAVMDVRPTQSVTRYLQAAGRALRFQESKLAEFLDCVGNTFRHGLPDINRVWSLDDADLGKPEDPAEKGSNLRSCPKCMTLYSRVAAECPYCGHQPTGREVIEVDVEMEEVMGSMPDEKPPPKPKKPPKMTATKRAEVIREARRLYYDGDNRAAWEKLNQTGLDAGYHPLWAHHMADLIHIPDKDRI